MRANPIILPGLFTCLNLSAGMLSILMAFHGKISIAAWMIILAIIFDGLDGKAARMISAESQFGLHLDSLADIISAGAAPALLVYSAADGKYIFTGLLAIIYVLAAAYRLARFTSMHSGNFKGYLGLPAPIAGITLASFVLFRFKPANDNWIFYLMLLTAFSIAMLSTIPFHWPKLRWKESFILTARSVLFLILTVCMFVFSSYLMFPLFFIYILTSIFFGKKESVCLDK